MMRSMPKLLAALFVTKASRAPKERRSLGRGRVVRLAALAAFAAHATEATGQTAKPSPTPAARPVPTATSRATTPAPATPKPAPATPTAAVAKMDETSITDVKGTPRRRGEVKALGATDIVVRGRRLKVADVANTVFKEQRSMETSLKAARSALLADPVTKEEVIETDSTTIFVSTTSAIVVDPSKIPAQKGLDSLRRKKRSVKVTDLDAEQALGLRDIKASLANESSTHPLRKAADLGDQALLDALGEGKGEVIITDAVALPRPPSKGPSGGFMVPKSINGFFDYSQSSEKFPKFLRKLLSGSSSSKGAQEAPAPPSDTHKFLNGFSEGLDLVREKIWEGRGWKVRVNAHAWFGFGYRVPFQVKGTVSPRTALSCHSQDNTSTFKTTLTASTFDANKAFYQEMGLSGQQLFDGREVVLGAGAHFRLRVRALGKKIFDRTIGDEDYDFSADCTPSMAENSCGTPIWIPSEITGTKFEPISGITAEVRLGVRVSGPGKLRIGFEGLYGDGVMSSAAGTNTGAKLSIPILRPTQTVDVTTTLLPVSMAGQRAYGYRISGSEYEFSPHVQPGVRGDVSIDVAGLGGSWTVAEWWGPKLELGTLVLGPHEGTPSTASFTPGQKTFRPGPTAGGACVAERAPPKLSQ
jgi:hypothetical protein